MHAVVGRVLPLLDIGQRPIVSLIRLQAPGEIIEDPRDVVVEGTAREP
jgi:hypothetical protein